MKDHAHQVDEEHRESRSFLWNLQQANAAMEVQIKRMEQELAAEALSTDVRSNVWGFHQILLLHAYFLLLFVGVAVPTAFCKYLRTRRRSKWKRNWKVSKQKLHAFHRGMEMWLNQTELWLYQDDKHVGIDEHWWKFGRDVYFKSRPTRSDKPEPYDVGTETAWNN